MAHFAELDENSVVLRVIVVNNSELFDAQEVEQEEKGIEFCKKLLGEETSWKQTSYNASFRGKLAFPGDTYDPILDVFVKQD